MIIGAEIDDLAAGIVISLRTMPQSIGPSSCACGFKLSSTAVTDCLNEIDQGEQH